MMANKALKYEPNGNLIMEQTNEQKVLLHYRDSKFYITDGTKVTKLHIVYRFRQSQWLAKLIKHNANQRTKAETKMEKLLQ